MIHLRNAILFLFISSPTGTKYSNVTFCVNNIMTCNYGRLLQPEQMHADTDTVSTLSGRIKKTPLPGIDVRH